MKLLVALDLTDVSHSVIEQVQRWTQGQSSQIWLLHVAAPDPDFVGYDTGPQTVRDYVAQAFQREHRSLQKIADDLRDRGATVTALLVQGATADTILAEAQKLDVDGIAIGARRKGLFRQLFLGSTTLEVLNRSPIPVLVVPPHER